MPDPDVAEFAPLLELLRGGPESDPVVGDGDAYRVAEHEGVRVLEVDGWDGPCRDGSPGEEFAHDLRIALLPGGRYRLWSREPLRTGPSVADRPRQPWSRGVDLDDFEDLHTWVYEL